MTTLTEIIKAHEADVRWLTQLSAKTVDVANVLKREAELITMLKKCNRPADKLVEALERFTQLRTDERDFFTKFTFAVIETQSALSEYKGEKEDD